MSGYDISDVKAHKQMYTGIQEREPILIPSLPTTPPPPTKKKRKKKKERKKKVPGSILKETVFQRAAPTCKRLKRTLIFIGQHKTCSLVIVCVCGGGGGGACVRVRVCLHIIPYVNCFGRTVPYVSRTLYLAV